MFTVYCIIAPLLERSCTNAPQNYSTTDPFYHRTILPQNHCTTELLNHRRIASWNQCTTELLHHATIAQQNHSTIAPDNHRTIAPHNYTHTGITGAADCCERGGGSGGGLLVLHWGVHREGQHCEESFSLTADHCSPYTSPTSLWSSFFKSSLLWLSILST